jgi:hypothetical protein
MKTMIEVEHPNDGKTYLKIANYLDDDGNYLDDYLRINPRHEFSKQVHRKKIQKPVTREILVCFFFNYDAFDTKNNPSGRGSVITFSNNVIKISMNKLQKYKIDLVKEKIELTEKNMDTITNAKKICIQEKVCLQEKVCVQEKVCIQEKQYTKNQEELFIGDLKYALL